jgi:hypothetical protein
MQGNLDEFLSARMGAGEDDDDAGLVIDVGSRAAVSMRSEGAASIADTSVGAGSLHVRFCTTRRTLFDDAGPEIAVGSRALIMRSEGAASIAATSGGAASIAAASVGAASLRVRFRTTRRTLFDEFLSARVGAEEDNVQFVISDFEGDSLIESMISESEGDVEVNDNFDENDNLPHPMQVPEGALPAAPNINDGPQRSTVDEMLEGPLAEELLFNHVHLLILKARSSVSREDNSTIEAQIIVMEACMRELISIEETLDYLQTNIMS